jgi:Ca2+-binding EF-hand superfamily protein
VTGNYDVSQSIVSETQLRAKFNEFDTKGTGVMSLAQLTQFYRAGSMFGEDDDEGRVLRFFETLGIRVHSASGVTFDEFAKVALKLAAR